MSKHLDKANRELIRKENRKLQIEQERLKERKRLAELQQKILSHAQLNENDRAKLLTIKNKSKARKYFRKVKRELINAGKEEQRKLYEKNIELAIKEGQIEILDKLINEAKQIPQIEDIINSAKYILCTQKRLIQTVKPIIAHLQEQGFNTENLDVAKILLETGEFHKGDWVKFWFFGKPNPIYFYLKQKTIIFWNGIVGFAQKYLLMLYRVFKPKELNQ